jgi:serine/threonine protein kinase
MNEIQILSTIGDSEFIVKYYEMLKTKNNYYFVYEYCNGGTLLDAIKK